MANSKMTDEQIMASIKNINVILSHLEDPADRASVCMEVAVRNMALALHAAGQDVTDKALFAMAQAMVAGWILTQERAAERPARH